MMTRGGFLGGLLLGIAIGGAFALLYAPERGDKTPHDADRVEQSG